MSRRPLRWIAAVFVAGLALLGAVIAVEMHAPALPPSTEAAPADPALLARGAELARAGRAKLANEYVDTVSLARRKFPGQRASLDALCDRFGIDNTKRTKHGALAEVYLELSGGRQRDLGLAPEMAATGLGGMLAVKRPVRPARPHAASAAELAAHAEFLKKVNDPIWLKE